MRVIIIDLSDDTGAADSTSHSGLSLIDTMKLDRLKTAIAALAVVVHGVRVPTDTPAPDTSADDAEIDALAQQAEDLAAELKEKTGATATSPASSTSSPVVGSIGGEQGNASDGSQSSQSPQEGTTGAGAGATPAEGANVVPVTDPATGEVKTAVADSTNSWH